MTALKERLSRALGAIDKDACKLAGAQVMATKKEWASFTSADFIRDSCFKVLENELWLILHLFGVVLTA